MSDNVKDVDQESENGMDRLVADSFKKVFESIDQFKIKEGVDTMGIDKFIHHCALLAGGTGAVAGMGGIFFAVVGIPADVLNNILQQFRVTLGVIYDKKGKYNVTFPEFMKIVGLSVGVEMAAVATRSVLVKIANGILARMAAQTALKMVPFIGAVIGASVNYGFIMGIGKAVQRLEL